MSEDVYARAKAVVGARHIGPWQLVAFRKLTFDTADAALAVIEAARCWVDTAERAGLPKDIDGAYVTMTDCFDAGAACKGALSAYNAALKAHFEEEE